MDANSPHRVLSLFFSLRARSIDRHHHRLVSHRAVTPCASRCDHASPTPTHRRRDAIQPPSHHHTRAHAPPHPSRRIAASVPVAPRQNPKTTVIVVARARWMTPHRRRRPVLRDAATPRDYHPTHASRRVTSRRVTHHDDHARVEETARDAAASHGPARTGRRRAGFGHSTPTPAPVRPESPIHGDSRTHIWWYTTYSTPLEQSLSIYIDHQPWCPGRPNPHPGGRRRRRGRRRRARVRASEYGGFNRDGALASAFAFARA